MRISSQPAVDTEAVSQAVQSQSATVEKVVKQGSSEDSTTMQSQQSSFENNGKDEDKLKKAVDSLNEILEINQNSSKFVYHEGLDRYFVQMIDKETEEVVKEIPSKKILDAFYEMQKLVGMIVDEKI